MRFSKLIVSCQSRHPEKTLPTAGKRLMCSDTRTDSAGQ